MVSIIMGSDSDIPVVKKAVTVLKDFGVPYEVKILSAHRTPELVREYVTGAEQNGTKIFIGAAGKAAHLPGVIASFTTLPVIGIPIKTPDLQGMDSLLSIVQMPPAIPVATVGIDGAANAALLAIQMLSIAQPEYDRKLKDYRAKMVDVILEKNSKIEELLGE